MTAKFKETLFRARSLPTQHCFFFVRLLLSDCKSIVHRALNETICIIASSCMHEAWCMYLVCTMYNAVLYTHMLNMRWRIVYKILEFAFYICPFTVRLKWQIKMIYIHALFMVCIAVTGELPKTRSCILRENLRQLKCIRQCALCILFLDQELSSPTYSVRCR